MVEEHEFGVEAKLLYICMRGAQARALDETVAISNYEIAETLNQQEMKQLLHLQHVYLTYSAYRIVGFKYGLGV